MLTPLTSLVGECGQTKVTKAKGTKNKKVPWLRDLGQGPSNSRIVCSIHSLVFLAEVAMLLGASFLGDSGHRLSTRLFVSFLALIGSILAGLYVGLFLHTYALYSLESH